ncbi:uncharacterized protein L969DRAFT_55311 [Mixia osmundae IAM 14324]|uniref:Single-stranded DNA-binding protein n=1 Tax=Mixia osmundae (strain CBS 9802 / IAM 14324 / JCM 22182 / KY 12970) TaxID=764103 RepID=G7E4I3_MIXOS|nr:uncharacterized protein L969DRAFT_55311 [Mixia osmundae IAM 14324]KEI36240.1 hypothetical protein L969DRAFT_55311 [Mixia osmundae IAM 14324]GAA97743.1 hypothetical protein E5Q_04422 [Mixia osmundae IAM 14324]
MTAKDDCEYFCAALATFAQLRVIELDLSAWSLARHTFDFRQPRWTLRLVAIKVTYAVESDHIVSLAVWLEHCANLRFVEIHQKDWASRLHEISEWLRFAAARLSLALSNLSNLDVVIMRVKQINLRFGPHRESLLHLNAATFLSCAPSWPSLNILALAFGGKTDAQTLREMAISRLSRVASQQRRAFSATSASHVAKLTLIGRLGTPPVTGTDKRGQPFTRFVIATSRRGPRREDGAPAENVTSWHDVISYKIAESEYMQNLEPGTLVNVEADYLPTAVKTDDGKTYANVFLNAQRIDVLQKPRRKDGAEDKEALL